MISKNFYGAALMGTILVAASLQGCSSDNPLCCTEFKPGIEITGAIGGSVQSQVAIQAVADFSGIASAEVDDLTAACQHMAADLDADPNAVSTAMAEPDPDKRLTGVCTLAISSIKAAIAVAGTLKVNYTPAQCSASFSAKASCDAKCSGSVTPPACNYKIAANLPTCDGGKLEVSCKGGCTGSAGASVSCTGSCTGDCTGDCTATGGVAVDCAGKCDGTCTAGGSGSAAGNGIQADGSCKGSCQGTCHASATPVAVKCQGSCQGSCTASCQGTATASVTCDGTCDGDITPLKCSGGTLKASASCTPPSVNASCSGSCDASVKAKAECTPPDVSVTFSGTADVNIAGKLKATLEANFGAVLSATVRLKGMADIVGTFSGNISAVTDIKAACIPVVIAQIGTSTASLTNTVSVTGNLVASVGSGS